MALADILQRIAADSREEANALLAQGEAEAERTLHDARVAAERLKQETLKTEVEAAEMEAATRLASARLRARDRAVAERRALVERVLTLVRERMTALPDAEYAKLLARGVSAVARGGEKVLIGGDDASRLRSGLAEALAACGVSGVTVSDEPADVAQGVVVIGDRVRAEVSPAAMIEARREELTLSIAEILFGEKDE